ncbi:MAG: PEP-CTERM sorting domain-containing protein [Kiloniellaceae bacterium]
MARHAAVLCTALVMLLPVSHARAGIIFEQTVDLTVDGYASDFSYRGSDPPGLQVADDFRLQPGASTVTGVQWWGAYDTRQALSLPDAFTIRLFGDVAGRPAAAPLYEFFVGDSVGRTDSGFDVGGLYDVYFYSAQIAATTLLAGTTYWLSVVNDTAAAANYDWYWSTDNRFTITYNRDTDSDPWGPDATPVGFRLTDDALTTVPEPASLALFGAGLAGLGLLRRRQPRR